MLSELSLLFEHAEQTKGAAPLEVFWFYTQVTQPGLKLGKLVY